MQLMKLVRTEPESIINFDDSAANTQILYSDEYEITQLTDEDGKSFRMYEIIIQARFNCKFDKYCNIFLLQHM